MPSSRLGVCSDPRLLSGQEGRSNTCSSLDANPDTSRHSLTVPSDHWHLFSKGQLESVALRYLISMLQVSRNVEETSVEDCMGLSSYRRVHTPQRQTERAKTIGPLNSVFRGCISSFGTDHGTEAMARLPFWDGRRRHNADTQTRVRRAYFVYLLRRSFIFCPIPERVTTLLPSAWRDEITH